MSKTDDRESQYKFVEDEDIFEEDEKRMAARKKEAGWMSSSATKSSSSVVCKEPPSAFKRRHESQQSRFKQDAIVLQRDAAKFHRAVRLLMAIPPPPSTTNPQFTLHNILDLWTRFNSAELKSKWKDGMRAESVGHDVYLNSNKYLEGLEHLRPRLTERFVSNETASHLTFVPPLMTERDKELQKRNGWIKSPASRVNNLSQRQVFYSQFSKPVRTFTLENSKKLGLLKSNSESKISLNINATKRALFQSPEKHLAANLPASNYSSASSSYSSTLPPSNYSVASAASTSSTSSSSSLITPASRSSLSKWTLSRGETKQLPLTPRSRESSIKRNCSKSLKFDEQPSADKFEKAVKKPKKLSQLHSKKMLWAVETLLKSEGVVSSDAEYKMLYANIYREATQVWLKYYEKKENGKVKDGATGTSDLMVNVAETLLPSVEQKLGITCSSIKSRKVAAKRNADLPTKDNNVPLTKHSSSVCTTVSSSSVIQDTKMEAKNKSCEVSEEVVFSPEMMGVSTLCEGIDAVISSLDDIPPDPGDGACTAHLITAPVAVLSATENMTTSTPASCIQNLFCTPSLNSNLNNLTVGAKSMTTPINCTVDGSCLSVCAPECTVLSLPCTSSSNSSSLITSNLPESNSLSSSLVCNIIEKNMEAPTSFENCVKNSKTEVINDKTDVEDCKTSTSPLNRSGDKGLTCIVKLERCDHLITDNKVSTTHHLLSVPPTTEENMCHKTSPKSGSVETFTIADKKISPKDERDGSLASSSSTDGADPRRSKRKRNFGVSSNESTPTSSDSKLRTSKRICSDKTQMEISNNENRGPLRKSSRNKPHSNNDANQSNIDSSSEMSLGKVKEDTGVGLGVHFPPEADDIDCSNDAKLLESVEYAQTCSDTVLKRNSLVPASNNSNSSDSGIAVLHQGECSSSTNRDDTSNNIDKENDSSMENISDVDTQNWSPILKLKRSSTNLWSSELKKKRIPKRKKDRCENSPVGSPFLDLEGPFKYRLCKRALPGEFVSVIIKGQIYCESYLKMVKKKSIGKDCILVRSVQQGIELRIPLELFQRQRVFLGTNKFQNMIRDITEDAICKLEGIDTESNFGGFTSRQVNEAVVASYAMDRVLKSIKERGQVVKPLFTVYKYAIVKQTPRNLHDYYQILVEISRSSLFLSRNFIDHSTIQVRPLKSESPKKIQLEINVPVSLMLDAIAFKDNILKDLNPIHNIISC